MSRRDEAADLDLVPLDPVTGATLGPDLDEVGTGESPDDAWAQGRRRARRRHRLAVVLAGASLASALMAAWFGLSIRNLRSVERTWRSAMAVDQARVTADLTIRALADGDSSAARQPLDQVGDEAAARLQVFERTLDRRRILDPKVSALRDEMVEALRFRRFQMTPERLQLGNTPLLRVDGMLDDQLERWDLDHGSVRQPELRSLDAAIDGLRQFSTRPTRTRLAAITDAGRIVEIDVDASTVQRNPIGEDPHNGSDRTTALFTYPGGGVAATVGETLRVLRREADGDPLHPAQPDANVPLLQGSRVFAAGPTGNGAAFWIVPPSDESLVIGGVVIEDSPSKMVLPVVGDLPEDRTVVGANSAELILTTNPQRGQLERWNPATGATTVLASNARFLAANDDLMLWQGPLDFSDTGNGGFLHLLHLDTGQRDLIGLARTDAASAAISPDGKTIAVAAGPLAGRIGSVLMLEVGTTGLVGTSGPRVAVDGPAMTWSPDSRTLFWRTPDGELAVRHAAADGQPPQSERLRTGLRDLTAVVAFGR